METFLVIHMDQILNIIKVNNTPRHPGFLLNSYLTRNTFSSLAEQSSTPLRSKIMYQFWNALNIAFHNKTKKCTVPCIQSQKNGSNLERHISVIILLT